VLRTGRVVSIASTLRTGRIEHHGLVEGCAVLGDLAVIDAP
jgi:hypothetical protein